MNQPMKQYEVLKRASIFLEKNHCEPNIAEILLRHHLQVSRTTFYTDMQRMLPPDLIKRLFNDLNEHVKTGIPVQHLIGYTTFYERRFKVNEHVLIPRQETEELVDHVHRIIKNHYSGEKVTVADLGTGSGVIAVTIDCLNENAEVFAVDISKKALQIARYNATYHQSEVHFLHGDFCKPLIKHQITPEIIVANPPYIAEDERPLLSRTVKDFDPPEALFAKENGLFAYRTIVSQLQQFKKPPKIIAFEIGHKQGEAVQNIIKKQFPASQVNILQDLNKKDRFVIASLSEKDPFNIPQKSNNLKS